MSWKLRAAVSALLLAPQAAWALGLGDIRLNSALNEPLSAEIDLVAPTADELNTMSAQLASRELFQRYGLDRPAFLDEVQFRVGRGRDGRNVLLVNSTAPVNEPFVTFLVELNWPRGRLLREYTVLLDPPVFAPAEAAPPEPVAAPRVSRPAPAPAAAPAAAPPAEQPSAPVAREPVPTADAPAAAPSTYRVQRGDTLYGIASRLTGGDPSAANRMMIAMFRASPEAFGGNINLLLAGAILRIPGPDAVSAVGPQEARSEISRQNAQWRGGEAAEDAGRLRLVAPTEELPAAAAAEPPAADLEARIDEVRREIDESRRLLELRNAELAQLQSRLTEREAAAAAAPAVEPSAEEAPAEAPVAAPAEPEPAVAAEPEPAAPSFFDSLTDNWTYLLGAAALLLGGGLAWSYVRRRREEDLDEALRSFEPPATAPVPSETQRLRTLTATAAPGEIVVEERKPVAKPAPARRKPEPVTDDTISTEAPLDLDEGDPLAEADFHMAYGLYDQATDIIDAALEKEPARTDYQVKALEIFFVSDNKERFRQAARSFKDSGGDGVSAEWDRIAIMGRQLLPDEPLFAGATKTPGVDLNLEGGASRVDLELLGPPEGDEGIDLDLGEALGGAADSAAETGEAAAVDLQAGKEAPTVEMPAGREPTAEMPTLEVPSGETPTIRTSQMEPPTGDTIRDRVGAVRPGMEGVSTEATVEMAVDDLGIDLGDLESLAEAPAVEEAEEEEATRLMPGTEGEDDGTALLPAAESGGASDDLGTALLPELDETAIAPAADDETLRVDLDVGASMADSDDSVTATERMSLSDLPKLSELEPVTMSEVGTKLDLARAYVDMGDPDGARSILREVLQEGSSQQKQEAQRLLDSLPGA